MYLERARSGTILVDRRGRPVYRFPKDTAGGVGEMSCAGSCAGRWSPVLLPAADLAPVAPPALGGQVGVVLGPDGARHVALDGSPLYVWAGPGAPPAGPWQQVTVASTS